MINFASLNFLSQAMSQSYNLIVIVGPTATGKTQLATHLASQINGAIISADSRQIYRGMDLGTGKDLAEYIVSGQSIPYYLIDICEPGYKYNIFEYQADFFKAFETVRQHQQLPIMCGGSGLYIESVLKQYKLINVPVNEPLRQALAHHTLEELTEILKGFRKLHNTTNTDTKARAIRTIEIETYYQSHTDIDTTLPALSPLIIGVDIDVPSRRQKITHRLKERLDNGMIEEVQQLLDRGIQPDDLIYYGLEYKYLTLYCIGQLSYQQMFEQLNIAIHQFAKRQMTWFRKMERSGFEIHWIDAHLPMDEKMNQIVKLWEL
jgi:tRNA dimethylallyltransferase